MYFENDKFVQAALERNSPVQPYPKITNHKKIIYEEWKDEDCCWIPRFQIDNIQYDKHNNKISELEKEMVGSEWWNSARREYQYDKNNNLIEELTSAWDWQTGTWKNLFKWTFNYNEHNLIKKSIAEVFHCNGWQKVENENILYDEHQNKTESVFGSWDVAGDAFVQIGKNLFTYEENKIQTKIVQMWQSNKWVDTYKFMYGYHANNVEILLQTFSENNWNSTSKIEKRYDVRNNLLSETDFHWKLSGWIKKTHTEYSYKKGILEHLTKKVFSENREIVSMHRDRYVINA